MATGSATIAQTAPGAPKGRPVEMQDALNRFIYHPLSARLARLLSHTFITPNMVSVCGLLLVWGAAYCYAFLSWPQGFLIGFAMHLSWHVVDGADGDLARMTGRTSPLGEMIDGICDYAGHIVLYLVLGTVLANSMGGWIWFVVVGAGLSHIAQTNHAETQRRHYMWWVYGVSWLRHARPRQQQGALALVFGGLAHLYLRLSEVMTPWSGRIDAAMAAAQGDPERIAHIREVVRANSRESLLLEKLVGPNPRTILLGISMGLGSSLWFFLAELVALNALLVFSVIHHNRVGRRVMAAIG